MVLLLPHRPTRLPIATSTTPVAPPLDFDYNDGVSSDSVDFDDDDDDYGATSINHGDDDADDDTSTQPLRADETGVDRHLPHPSNPHIAQTHEGEHR